MGSHTLRPLAHASTAQHTCSRTHTHVRTHTRTHRYGIDVEIQTEKEMYYDKEVVRGEVQIKAEREVILNNAMIILLCRFVCKDPATGKVWKLHCCWSVIYVGCSWRDRGVPAAFYPSGIF